MRMAGFTDLPTINERLPDDWQAYINDQGRIYYISNKNKTAQWLPPPEGWNPDCSLPYGWESAIDRTGQPYYIDHVGQTTQREEPKDAELYEQPEPRSVQLTRDPTMGFGFVAGSEKPVIVRFVTEGGPSENKLLPGDEILAINGEEVRSSAREHVIHLVRSCETTMLLTVCQPQVNNSNRKSAILTAAKRARLREKPARVRFADTVTVNGSPMLVAREADNMPILPNVIRIYLENGQTRSFKFDDVTTVKDVLDALQEKLQIQSWQHFALSVLDTTTGRISLLQTNDTLAQIAARPGAQFLRCILRLAFLPQDGFDLLQQDSAAFEYLYMQCCNDIVEGRFPLKQDIVLRLAALHMHQHALSTSMGKVSVKAIRKACGLEQFLPENVCRMTKKRELVKLLGVHLKGYSSLTEVSAKLHYTKLAQEHCNRCFLVTLMEERAEIMFFVGPTCGIASSTDFRTNSMKTIVGFANIKHITLMSHGHVAETTVQIFTNDESQVDIRMAREDVTDFISLIEGYYRLQIDPNCSTLILPPSPTNNNTEIYDSVTPAYKGVHFVLPEPWSYTKEYVTNNCDETSERAAVNTEQSKESGDLEQMNSDSTVTLTANTDQSRTMVMDFSHCPPNSDDLYENVDTTDSETDWKFEAPLASPDPSGSEWSISVEAEITAETENDDLSDSDDDTPNTSPYKRLNRSSQYRQSFGLYRPVSDPQVNDTSSTPDVIQERLSESVEEIDKLHPHYNPMLFCDGGIYLDPDIIDLTLIPPPATPDRDTLTEFPMSIPSPPAGFEDEDCSPECQTPVIDGQPPGGKFLPADLADLPDTIRDRIDMLVLDEKDLGSQMAAFEALLLGDDEEKDEGVESETDSGNETISSETVNGHSDVEEFIANMSVPPPPWIPPRPPVCFMEDDLLQLVIPPPPVPVTPSVSRTSSQADRALGRTVSLPVYSQVPMPSSNTRITVNPSVPASHSVGISQPAGSHSASGRPVSCTSQTVSRTRPDSIVRRPKCPPPPPPPRRSSLHSSSSQNDCDYWPDSHNDSVDFQDDSADLYEPIASNADWQSCPPPALDSWQNDTTPTNHSALQDDSISPDILLQSLLMSEQAGHKLITSSPTLKHKS